MEAVSLSISGVMGREPALVVMVRPRGRVEMDLERRIPLRFRLILATTSYLSVWVP
jgi:hypothetical protein